MGYEEIYTRETNTAMKKKGVRMRGGADASWLRSRKFPLILYFKAFFGAVLINGVTDQTRFGLPGWLKPRSSINNQVRVIFVGSLSPAERRPYCWQVAKGKDSCHKLSSGALVVLIRPNSGIFVPWVGPGTKSIIFMSII